MSASAENIKNDMQWNFTNARFKSLGHSYATDEMEMVLGYFVSIIVKGEFTNYFRNIF